MSSFESLLKYNENLFQQFIKRPFFLLLMEQKLKENSQKEKFLNCVQVFSNEFQKILFARQASCVDKKFIPTFTRHFNEELGHDELLLQRKNIENEQDSILVASSSWFVWQMFVRDNIEKVVLMHLVLEMSGDFYHSIATKVFNDEIESNYFDIHAELDEFHANMGVDLLEGLSSEDYHRLETVAQQGWRMLTVMVDRTYQLVSEC